jgi:hypothetical protein
MKEEENENALASITQMRLTAVCFVQDYVEFHFEGPILTAYEWPVLFIAGDPVTESSPSYRDHLCKLIAKKTVQTIEVKNKKLILIFENDYRLEIPVDPLNRSSVEAAMIVDSTRKKISVW